MFAYFIPGAKRSKGQLKKSEEQLKKTRRKYWKFFFVFP